MTINSTQHDAAALIIETQIHFTQETESFKVYGNIRSGNVSNCYSKRVPHRTKTRLSREKEKKKKDETEENELAYSVFRCSYL